MSENYGERVKWIDHKGVRILYCDYSKMRGETYVKHLEYQLTLMTEEFAKKPAKVCVVIDATNAVTDKTIKKLAQSTFTMAKEAGVKFNVTVLGVTKVIRIIAQAINRDMYFAADRDDALAWLAKQ